MHMRIAHKLNEDTAGAPVATTVNSSLEPTMQSTSINDLQTEFKGLKDFMISGVNSLGSNFEKELITINNRISEINPQFTKETPAPSNIDTPYMIATNNTDIPCINCSHPNSRQYHQLQQALTPPLFQSKVGHQKHSKDQTVASS